MKNKEKKSYANKLINLEHQLKNLEEPLEREKIEFKIETLVEEIMSTENGFEDFLEIDEIVQKNI
jgi:hypothetical protein